MNYRKYFTSEEFLAITETYGASTKELVNKEATTMYSEKQRLIIAAVLNCDEQTVAEVLKCYHQCSPEMSPDDARYHHLIGIIRGLHEYPQYKNVQLDTIIDDTTVKQDPAHREDFNKITALINITSMLYREFENPPLHIQTPDDPSTFKIWLQPQAADLAFKHYELILSFIPLYANGGHEIAHGITRLNWFKHQDINNVTGQTVQSLYDYYRVTQAIVQHAKWENIKEDTPKALWLDNPELEEFIENNPEQIEALMPYIKDRGTADLGGFHEYIGNNTVLQSGVL